MSQTSPVCGHTINLDNLHFTADELRSLNELVVLKVLEAPNLSLFHSFVTGIKNDRHIGIIPGSFGLIGKAAQMCNPVPQCYELPATEKTWSPKRIEFIVDMCVDEVNDSLMKFALKCGVDYYDLTKTEIFTWLEDILARDLQRMIFRYAWFGDVSAAQFPVGNLTPGTDPDFFNVLDGFWVQLAAIYAADPTRLTAFTGNSQATTALQKSVATPALIMADLNNLVDSAHPILSTQPDRVLLVTQSVFQRAYRGLQGLGNGCCNFEVLQNGFNLMTWDGIPMYSVPLWDEVIAAYENNGTTLNDPHRAVLTTKSSLLIGMECTSLFDNINSFYDPRSRYNRIEAVDAFDMKIIDDRLVQVGR